MLVLASMLSPSQKAALEELIGRKLSDEETVRLDTFVEQQSSASEREKARENLLAFLRNSPRPRPGVSEEEMEAAILEAIRSVRGSGYTEIQ